MVTVGIWTGRQREDSSSTPGIATRSGTVLSVTEPGQEVRGLVGRGESGRAGPEHYLFWCAWDRPEVRTAPLPLEGETL